MLKQIFLMLCLALSNVAIAKSLALSFDDGLDPDRNKNAYQINAAILKTLEQAHILAIIYPSISKIGGKNGLEIISTWGMAGHRIGNHGNLHINLNKTEVNLLDYLKDINEGHDTFSKLLGFVPRYRFPYLKEGNTIEKRDHVRNWLKTRAYRSGAVSIDASDWYYNQLFINYQKSNDIVSLQKLKRAYIFHLLNRANYYNDLALTTIGRSPKHIILLHINEINAAWLADIIVAFKQNHWQFIDSDSAYQDPMYKLDLNLQALPAGESLLWSIAKNYGIKDLRYPAENADYEYSNLKNFGLNIIP